MYFNRIKLIGLATIELRHHSSQPTDRYILKNVDGLDPPDVDVQISEKAVQGGIYQGRRPSRRELIFRIGLNPAYSVGERHGDLRTELYGLLSPGTESPVRIQLLHDDTIVAITSGWVKKFEGVPFAKDPEVQITFACLEPYLSAPEEIELIGYPNPALNVQYPAINNPGTAPTGFRMEIVMTLSYYYWALYKDGLNEFAPTMYIGDPAFSFAYGDRLIIDTNSGSREITLNRLGVKTNLLYLLSANSTWLQLNAGINQMFTYPYNTFNWLSFKYTPKYWGV